MSGVHIEPAYTVIEDLAGLLDEIQTESIVSRTFFKGEQLKAILFGFAAGQELSEHTSSQAVTLQIVQGEATVTLGDETHELGPGSWVYIPPRLKHSVYAKTQMVMLLEMLDSQ